MQLFRKILRLLMLWEGTSVGEAELIKAAQEGDRDALVQLLREVEPSVYRTAYYLLSNVQDALDASQETLIRLYTKIGMYQEKAQFKTWVQRITTNVCIDMMRKKHDNVSFDEIELVLKSTQSVEEEVVLQDMTHDIHEAINELPEHHRTVVILRYLQDFSYSEISDSLNLPLNTVKSYLFRARQQLQKRLYEYEKGGVRG